MKKIDCRSLLEVIAFLPVLMGSAFAQPIPVGSLIESVDLKCYRIEGDVQSLDLPLVLDHLNPVLREMGVPPAQVIVREPQQLCVPVMKNGRRPPDPVYDFIAYLDLECYRVESNPPFLGLPLRLDHLNPVFRERGVPPEQVHILDARQLCVPVIKNNRNPPDAVRAFVENVDLSCWGIQSDIQDINFPLFLDHLNPVLQEMGAPTENVIVHNPKELCLPVTKNGRIPPDDVRETIKWLDLKKYAIESDVASLGIPLHLDHINPVLMEMGVAPQDIIVQEPQELGVPVAKNMRFPPYP